MPSCIIEGCPNRTGRAVLQEGIILHSFPTRFANIRKWLESTGQAFRDIDALANKILEGKANDLFRLCSTHFTPDCYKSKGKRKGLKKDSVPSVFATTQYRLINEEAVMASGKKRPRQTAEFPVEICETTYLCSRCQRSLSDENPILLKDSSTQTDANEGLGLELLHGLGVERITQHLDHPYNVPNSIPLNNSAGVTLGHQTVSPALHVVLESPIHIRLPNLASGTILNTPVQIRGALDQQKNHSGNLPSSQANALTQREGALTTSTFSNIPESNEKCHLFDIGHRDSDSGVLQESESTLPQDTADKPQDYISKIVKMRKFLVFESSLDELLKKVRCQENPSCLKSIVKINKQFRGSAVIVRGVCEDGHRFKIFESQPKIKRHYSGNVLLASSVVCAGLNFSEVHDFFKIFGMLQFSEKSFHLYQKKFSLPAINLAWQNERCRLLQEFSGSPVTIAGGGQCDRVGHKSKYCVYSLMDIVSGKVLDFEVVQSTKSSSPIALEEHAFEMCMSRAIDQGLDVVFFASDRCVGIQKLIQEKFSHINYQFDVWQYSKHVLKKIREASQKKSCAGLTSLIDKVYSHFWWAIENCENDEELLIKNWQSLMNRVVNAHEWEEGTTEKCSLTESKEEHLTWLQEGTPAYEKLLSIVNDQQLISDLKHLAWSCRTDTLKLYHKTVLKCPTKNNHIRTGSMECRTILAALSNNNNVQRHQTPVTYEQKTSGKCETNRFRLTAPKGEEKRPIRNVREGKKIDFLFPILEDTLRLCEGSLMPSWVSRSSILPPNIQLSKA
ncbi:protein XNDC1N isoform X1 [Hyperolius riggenbachi]|uniref:protein XNDC1N isoform X1 n=1 Tax=Hyperolius riggenbachi TaxID=752182 RepID=UPI0035A262B7